MQGSAIQVRTGAEPGPAEAKSAAGSHLWDAGRTGSICKESIVAALLRHG